MGKYLLNGKYLVQMDKNIIGKNDTMVPRGRLFFVLVWLYVDSYYMIINYDTNHKLILL